MTAFFVSIWLAIMSVFSFAPETDTTAVTPTTPQQPPASTPLHSAPQRAIQACDQKIKEEKCSFTLNDTSLEGICIPSGKDLACSPILPQ